MSFLKKLIKKKKQQQKRQVMQHLVLEKELLKKLMTLRLVGFLYVASFIFHVVMTLFAVIIPEMEKRSFLKNCITEVPGLV